MSNLEHLVENGLMLMKKDVPYEEWNDRMSKDPNWLYNENITLENLWEICQYVYYTWSPW